jgi:hypothetical protein
MVQQTGYRRVGLLNDVYRRFEKLEERWKSKFKNHFKNYGIPNTVMPREHFNTEGRFGTGGSQSRNVQLFAFKAFQHRLYGVTVPFQGFETFVGLELITDKKTNKADQELLKRVAKKFGTYCD